MFICEKCGYSTKIKCNFTKHQNRKTDCGDKNTQNNNNHTQNNNNHTLNNNNHTLNNNYNIPSNNNNTLNNNNDDINNNNIISYTNIDTNIVKCNLCDKQLTRRSFYGHKSVCKKVPKNTCEYCKVRFSSQQSHSRHRKTCKHRIFMTDNNEQQSSNDHMTINNNNNTTNNITNNITNTTTNNNHFNIFGKEELGYILENMETDPRIRQCLKSLVDTIELVHFNKDHPENHTVRKLTRKDNSCQFREHGESWRTVSCNNGFKTLQDNLERSLSTRFRDVPSVPTLRDLMYSMSSEPTTALKPTDLLLNRFEDDNSPSSCMNDVLRQRLTDLKNEYMSNIPSRSYGAPWYMNDLLTKWNNVLQQHNEAPINIEQLYCKELGLKPVPAPQSVGSPFIHDF